MLRLWFIVITGFLLILYYLPQMDYVGKHPDKYTEVQSYELAVKIIKLIKRQGRIKTAVYGVENLPEAGGYIMVANHQGKYDALGIMASHKKPCSVVMDYSRSKLIVADQFISLVRGQRLDKSNPKSQIELVNEVASQIKDGRRYLLFPEGGYDNNHNTLQEFTAGSFKIAQKAKCPIVPIVLFDSYKPFGINSLRAVTTQVHYLKPIPYENYKDMKTSEIRDMIVNMIQKKLLSITTLESAA